MFCLNLQGNYSHSQDEIGAGGRRDGMIVKLIRQNKEIGLLNLF